MLNTALLSMSIFFATATFAAAQQGQHVNTPAASNPTTQHAQIDSQPHPVLPNDADWAVVMNIIIGGAFLCGVIGPLVRANMPEEIPPYSHDEPPGSSGHHGASGTAEYRP